MSNLPTMSAYLTADKTKNYLEKMLGNKTEQFVTALSTMVGQNPQLNLCERSSILGCALKAVGMGLSFDPNLGFAYVIPYKDNKANETVATFQMGVKGFIQLAQRSGQIKKLNAMAVKEGEFKGRDTFGDPILQWLPENERVSKTTIGYMSAIQLNSGFEKTIYWTIEEIKNHAEKYSQSYKSALKYGDTAKAVWVDNFDAMARKTILKQLIKDYAPMSIELQQAVQYDQAKIVLDVENEKETVVYVDNQEEEIIKVVSKKQIMELANLVPKETNLEDLIGYKTLKEIPESEFEVVKSKLNKEAGVVEDAGNE
jgi:recombination protein RecT